MMKNALVGLFLGLLAVVQMTPIPTVTQIPAKAEEDVFREAVTDGFLVNHFFTTESPETNATQLPSSDPKEAVTEEPSQESTTTVFIQHGGDHDTTTTDSPSGSTSSSVPNDTEPSTTTTHTSAAPTTTAGPAVSGFLNTLSSDSGSGDREESDQDATTTFNTAPVSNTDSDTAASTSTLAFIRPRMFGEVEESGSGSTAETSVAPTTSATFLFHFETTQEFKENEGSGDIGAMEEDLIRKNVFLSGSVISADFPQPIVEPSNSPSGASSGTPGWIIIVGFIVGVAMLVMLCVAIATRDKWNGPRKVAKAEPKVECSNQPNGQEMETFLSKEEPMENGKSDYSVIPLEDLPESYSSH